MIEVDGLTKRFGSTLAVDDLTFSVEPGKITGFLGPNGAGKSTTMRAILGLVRPTAGRTAVLGVEYRELDRPVRRVGVLLETFDAHPGRTGRNHLRVLALAGGIPKSRVDEVLGLVDLREAGRRRVKGYSLGMRQRLGLAAALLGDPEALVLDEAADGAWRAILAAALAGLLGAAIGGAVHSQVGALVGVLLWMFVLEPICWVVLGLLDADGVSEYLPAAALGGSVESADEGLPWAASVGITVAWAALATVLAALRTSRRDIT